MANFKTIEFMLNKVETLSRKAATEETKRKHLEEIVAQQGREIALLKSRVSELETCVDKKNITVNVSHNDGIIGSEVSDSNVDHKDEGGSEVSDSNVDHKDEGGSEVSDSNVDHKDEEGSGDAG